MARGPVITVHEDTVPLTLRLPAAVHAALKQDCQRSGKSLNTMIIEAVAAGITRRRRQRERRASWATSAAPSASAH